MLTNRVITNTTPVQVYSFDAVFNAIQPYLKEGFKFDLESNEYYPQQIGTVYTFCIQEYRTEDIPNGATPEETEETEETEELLEVVTQIPTVVLPKTRRAKNQG